MVGMSAWLSDNERMECGEFKTESINKSYEVFYWNEEQRRSVN